MLRKKNVKIFTLLMIMFCGPVSATYEDPRVALKNNYPTKMAYESKDRLQANLKSLDSVEVELCSKSLSDTLDARYATFCAVKNRKDSDMKKYSEFSLEELYEPPFKTAEECRTADLVDIETNSREARKKVYDLVKTIKEDIDATSVRCLGAESALNGRLKLITAVVGTCHFCHLDTLVEKFCNAFELSNFVEKCCVQKEILEKSLDDIKDYQRYSVDVNLSLSERAGKVLDKINQKRVSLLEETNAKYLYKEGGIVNISSLPQVKKQISSSQSQYVSDLDNTESTSGDMTLTEFPLRNNLYGAGIGLVIASYINARFQLTERQAKFVNVISILSGFLLGSLYA